MTSGLEGIVAHRVLLGGRVQGVGFRPFVYRLARREGLTGWVRNLSGQVEILAQGPPTGAGPLHRGAADEAPPLARPAVLSVIPEAAITMRRFRRAGERRGRAA